MKCIKIRNQNTYSISNKLLPVMIMKIFNYIKNFIIIFLTTNSINNNLFLEVIDLTISRKSPSKICKKLSFLYNKEKVTLSDAVLYRENCFKLLY
jgi:hypothetical protein